MNLLAAITTDLGMNGKYPICSVWVILFAPLVAAAAIMLFTAVERTERGVVDRGDSPQFCAVVAVVRGLGLLRHSSSTARHPMAGRWRLGED